MYSMLSLENVQTIVNILRPEIIESPTFLNADVLAKLGINTITGVQFQESRIVWVREGGTTRRYDSEKKLKSNAGKLIERKLEVTLSWNRYADNVQNYREKVPFAITAENTFEAPNSENAIRSIIASYNEDVFANLFFGDKSDKNTNKALSLYDGFYTQIDKAINDGEISTAKGNMVSVTPIVIAATNKAANWYAFKEFYNALPTKLKSATELVVMMSPECHSEIIEGYLSVYSHLQNTNDVDKDDFRFTTMPNVHIVSHPVMGTGVRMVATLPGNFDFGVDSLNNQTNVFVNNNPEDLNEYMFQIQSAQGTRIRQIESAAFCVNDADANEPLYDIQGDYETGSITLSVNDTAMGKITSTVTDLSDVQKGTSVTLTATPETGYEFVNWADGVKTAARTIIAKGVPTQYTAIFKQS